MLAEYEGFIYLANVSGNQVTLMTYDKNKALEGFASKRDYFKKTIFVNDISLTSLYEIHFWVKYIDEVEENEIWLVDEGRAVGLKSSIENEEVTIDVSHDARDKTWTQYDKGAASKIVKLKECLGFYVEKTFLKKNDKLVSYIKEKSDVSLPVLVKSMITNRSVNL